MDPEPVPGRYLWASPGPCPLEHTILLGGQQSRHKLPDRDRRRCPEKYTRPDQPGGQGGPPQEGALELRREREETPGWSRGPAAGGLGSVRV